MMGLNERWGERAFLALFLAASAVALNLQQMVDPDLFWHLRGGDDIWAAGRPVLADTWNYLFHGKVWVNQQWLTELLMSRAFAAGGFWGLMALRTAVALGTVALLLGALAHRPAVARYLSAAVFVGLNAKFFLFRTHTFSFLMMAGVLFVLERKRGWHRFLWLCGLFALWANLHAFFGLGLLVAGCYHLVEWWRTGRRFTPVALAPLASVPLFAAASLFNPFGWRVWETALQTLGHNESYLVTEWWPVWRYSFWANWNFYLLVAGLLLLCLLKPKSISWPSLVAAALLAFMGARSVRLTSVMTLPAMPLLASLLAGFFLEEEGSAESIPRPWKALVTSALLGLAALGLTWILSNPISVPSEVKREDYPVGAVNYMKANGLTGKIFNEFDWGGYLVWALPGCQTFIDGRTGVLLFPWGHMTAWRQTVDAEPGWRAHLEDGHPDFALLYADDIVTPQFAADPGWRPLYQDHLCVLFGREKGRPQSAGVGPP